MHIFHFCFLLDVEFPKDLKGKLTARDPVSPKVHLIPINYNQSIILTSL